MDGTECPECGGTGFIYDPVGLCPWALPCSFCVFLTKWRCAENDPRAPQAS